MPWASDVWLGAELTTTAGELLGDAWPDENYDYEGGGRNQPVTGTVKQVHTKNAKSTWCFIGVFDFPDLKDGKSGRDTQPYNVNFSHMASAPEKHHFTERAVQKAKQDWAERMGEEEAKSAPAPAPAAAPASRKKQTKKKKRATAEAKRAKEKAAKRRKVIKKKPKKRKKRDASSSSSDSDSGGGGGGGSGGEEAGDAVRVEVDPARPWDSDSDGTYEGSYRAGDGGDSDAESQGAEGQCDANYFSPGVIDVSPLRPPPRSTCLTCRLCPACRSSRHRRRWGSC